MSLLSCLLLAVAPQVAEAQRLLSLDSCRAMALRNNKQLSVSQLKQDVAANITKAARTKYLPYVNAIGSYQYTSEEISLLSKDQKRALSNLGNGVEPALQNFGTSVQNIMGNLGNLLVQSGVPAEMVQQMAGQMQQTMQQGNAEMISNLNGIGQDLVDAFRTDTRHIFAGAVMFTQPIYMGGSIVAMNRLADLNQDYAANSAEARKQSVVYDIDHAYWQAVSLHHKKQLAEGYLELVRKFDHDVKRMIEAGVATRSDGLSVSVKVNEAEMTLQTVNDGLTLSKMLLCQMTGLPLDEQITLADEASEQLAVVELTPQRDLKTAMENRPELKMLENVVDISRQTTNLLKAGNLPKVALTGGYAVSNPNTLNGFERKFAGFWNVGLSVMVPVWNWGDVAYKVRASKGTTAIANLELSEAREKISLQVSQNTFKVDEALKRLTLARKSIEQADENLRTANVGFKEGVITPSVVMEAQTAWLQAQTQLIDAEIGVKLSQTDLAKSLGILHE